MDKMFLVYGSIVIVLFILVCIYFLRRENIKPLEKWHSRAKYAQVSRLIPKIMNKGFTVSSVIKEKLYKDHLIKIDLPEIEKFMATRLIPEMMGEGITNLAVMQKKLYDFHSIEISLLEIESIVLMCDRQKNGNQTSEVNKSAYAGFKTIKERELASRRLKAMK